MNRVIFNKIVVDIMKSCDNVHWDHFSNIFVDCVYYTIETEI